MTRRRRPSPSCKPASRGAASLVVVMVLFFMITLVAAYTARNLLFEQRTSTNQYRSTLAFEAADAGIEWALARLNDGRMNENCTPVTSAGAAAGRPSFRERYLKIDEATGVITPLNTDGTLATTPEGNRIAGCIFNGLDNWVCDCPATGTPNPTVTYTGNGPFAAFWVRFVRVTPVAAGVTGVVRIQVNACTRADASCLDFTREAQPGDGLATVWAMANLRSALVSSPAAALTVRGAFSRGTTGSPTITITNTDSTSGGLTVNVGSGCPVSPIDTTGVTLNTIPGTPPQLSIYPCDPALTFPTLTLTPATPANDPNNLMFNSVFGMWPATYEAQPGLAEVDCSSDCTATDVNNQVLLNPGHVIRLRDGGATGRRLRIGANIGTATAPVIVVADSGVNVEFESGTPTVYGLIYSRASTPPPLSTWQLRGTGTVIGAAVAEQNFEFNNNDPSLIYDRDVLLRVRNLNGSFVKVPGGWRDFQP